MRQFLFSALAILAMQLSGAKLHAESLLYVSPQGNDTWSGQLAEPNSEKTDGPLATLAAARDAVRRLRQKSDQEAPNLVGVCYELQSR